MGLSDAVAVHFTITAFALLGTIPASDGQTHRQTRRYRKDRAMHSVARVKIVQKYRKKLVLYFTTASKF